MKTYTIEANGAVHTVQAECKPTKKMLREILNRAEQQDNVAKGRTFQDGRHKHFQFHQVSRGGVFLQLQVWLQTQFQAFFQVAKSEGRRGRYMKYPHKRHNDSVLSTDEIQSILDQYPSPIAIMEVE